MNFLDYFLKTPFKPMSSIEGIESFEALSQIGEALDAFNGGHRFERRLEKIIQEIHGNGHKSR
jgi:hypothetical protein